MTVSSDDDATRAMYGSTADLGSILERRVTLPQTDSVQRFLGAVTHDFGAAAVGVGEVQPGSGMARSR
jgi:hypothetical protein